MKILILHCEDPTAKDPRIFINPETIAAFSTDNDDRHWLKRIDRDSVWVRESPDEIYQMIQDLYSDDKQELEAWQIRMRDMMEELVEETKKIRELKESSTIDPEFAAGPPSSGRIRTYSHGTNDMLIGDPIPQTAEDSDFNPYYIPPRREEEDPPDPGNLG